MSSINELKSIIGGGGGAKWSGSLNGNNFIKNGTAFTFDIPVDSSTKVVDICIRIYSYTSSTSSAFGGIDIKLNNSYLARTSSGNRISAWNGTSVFKVYGLVNNGTLSAMVEFESPMTSDSRTTFGIAPGPISIPISDNKITFYALGATTVTNNGTVMAYTL